LAGRAVVVVAIEPPLEIQFFALSLEPPLILAAAPVSVVLFTYHRRRSPVMCRIVSMPPPVRLDT